MTVGISIDVDLTGPFFDGRTERNIRRALADTVQDVVQRSEGMVKAQLYPGHGLVTGNLRRSVAGERRGALNAIVATNTVYGPWIEGVSARNQTTRFKGYAMFRRTRQALQKMVPRLLIKHLRRRL